MNSAELDQRNHSPDVLRFGPSNVVNRQTGARFANPLATRIRFLYPTRAEGQAGLPYVHTVNMKVGYRIRFSAHQYVSRFDWCVALRARVRRSGGP